MGCGSSSTANAMPGEPNEKPTEANPGTSRELAASTGQATALEVGVQYALLLSFDVLDS
jgi:hypothetical protein